MPHRNKKQVFTIPSAVSFTDILAKSLIQNVQNKPSQLSSYLILLPTRRACRSLRDAFLKQSNGVPLLLPQMQSFGDIDADELALHGYKNNEFDLPPAITGLEREILLSQIIAKLPGYENKPAQNIALAKALAQLLDQIYTEGLDFNDLPNIVDREAFANHWQITIDFLKIVSENWPQILKERGVIDSADRRIRIINQLNQQWQDTKPEHPIIAAGTTGSIPATANLVKTIISLPQGSVILPGLDQYLVKDAWDNIEEGHPQYTIKSLLNHLNVERNDVHIWGEEFFQKSKDSLVREKILSHVMTPAINTENWTRLDIATEQKQSIKNNLHNVKRYDCETSQDEAQLISLILRETLEHPDKTAALITPDRKLAQRVRTLCKKWSINIDDSAGIPLSQCNLGQYLRLTIHALKDGITPLSLLSFLKHDLNQGAGFKNFRSSVRRLDKKLLRGIKPASGFDSLINLHKLKNIDDGSTDNKTIFDLLQHLKNIIGNDIDIFTSGRQNFKKLLEVHLNIAEKFASTDQILGSEYLWSGEAGEEAANLFSELYSHADQIQDVSTTEYIDIIDQFMNGISIRPAYGTHPRLAILGQLEARLIQADRVILAGLNEGIWPPDPGHDPWMSRPMRENFGLPLPERSITLAAHDFVQAACAQEVFFTRSKRIDNAPSVPARWLQRFDTFLTAIGINPEIMMGSTFLDYMYHLNKVDKVSPIEQPSPCPPVETRPRQISVTKIENWIKDPYSIYASQILRLKKLDSIEKEFDIAQRGTILHSILEKFVDLYPKNLPAGAQEDFLHIAKDVFFTYTQDQKIWRLWEPRLIKLADWLVAHEKQWRKDAAPLLTEAQGILKITKNIDKPFLLTARLDRMDLMNNGSIAIIDYKSGGTFSLKKIENGQLPQLPLEGLILEENGFSENKIKNKKIGRLEYWKLSGGNPAGQIITLQDPTRLEKAIENAKQGVTNLIQKFDNETTPYISIPNLDNAPTYNDYEHLERVKEWAALGDNDDVMEAV